MSSHTSMGSPRVHSRVRVHSRLGKDALTGLIDGSHGYLPLWVVVARRFRLVVVVFVIGSQSIERERCEFFFRAGDVEKGMQQQFVGAGAAGGVETHAAREEVFECAGPAAGTHV